MKFVTTNDPKIKEYADNFVKTFCEEENSEEFELKDFIKALKINSLKFAKQKDVGP